MVRHVVSWNMVDWGAGKYETTAAELEPVAQAVVEQAAPVAGEDVLDLACGTGNAALLAAGRGAAVIGIDAAPRLLEVARTRAQGLGVDLEVREGDLLALPVDDASIDVVLSGRPLPRPTSWPGRSTRWPWRHERPCRLGSTPRYAKP